MDLTPKKYKKKAKRKRLVRPQIIKHWRNPFQLAIVGIALASFVGSTVFSRIKEGRNYEVQVARSKELLGEINALNSQAMQVYSNLLVQCEGTVLKDKSDGELALIRKLEELNRNADARFSELNECYAAIAYRYRSRNGVLQWYADIARKHIEFALARKEHERARLCFNESHLNEQLGDFKYQVKGIGSLEVQAGEDVYKIVVWPLKLDGLRLVQADPVGSSQVFPYSMPVLESGSYLIWATRADGAFAPYPVFIGNGQSNVVNLVVPEVIPEGMVFVPGGDFLCGGGETSPYRLHTHNLSGFFIGKYEVTVSEYLDFWLSLKDPVQRAACMSRIGYDEGDAEPQAAWDADGRLLDKRLAVDLPVVGITFDAAKMFCEWKSRKTGKAIRLPTGFEWEKAARGVDGRAYPWGQEYEADANLALTLDNPKAKGKYPLWAPPGRFLRDSSVYNVNDMGGNVREFAIAPDGSFEIRGGSGSTPFPYMVCSHVSDSLDVVPSDVGFRYVLEVPAK